MYKILYYIFTTTVAGAIHIRHTPSVINTLHKSASDSVYIVRTYYYRRLF